MGAGKAGACHDMEVLQDCQADQRFLYPPPGLCLFCKLMMQQLCTPICCNNCFGTKTGNCSIVVGRYYPVDSGYMEQQGYMTPFRDTRYHKEHFRGVDVRTLDRQEKFNYIHSKLRKASERAVAYPGRGSILQEGKSKHGLSYPALH